MLSESLPMMSYEGSSSPAAPLDARFKVLVALVCGVAVFVAHDAWQFLSVAMLLLVFIGLTRMPVAILWSNVRPVFVFLIVGGGLIALTTQGPGWSFGFVHVSRTGLELAARLSAQLILLLSITSLVTYTTSPLAIANALRRLFGFLRLVKVPVEDMTTMLTLAITFIPIMSQEVDRFLTARAARGSNVRRLGLWSMLGDMLVPLIETNLQRGAELALALDTRIYGYGQRTHRGDKIKPDRASVTLLCGSVLWLGASLTFL